MMLGRAVRMIDVMSHDVTCDVMSMLVMLM